MWQICTKLSLNVYLFRGGSAEGVHVGCKERERQGEREDEQRETERKREKKEREREADGRDGKETLCMFPVKMLKVEANFKMHVGFDMISVACPLCIPVLK